jgi:hypothetical protein
MLTNFTAILEITITSFIYPITIKIFLKQAKPLMYFQTHYLATQLQKSVIQKFNNF